MRQQDDCCLSSSKARVLSIVLCRAPSADVSQKRPTKPRARRHRIKDATTCLFQVVKDHGSLTGLLGTRSQSSVPSDHFRSLGPTLFAPLLAMQLRVGLLSRHCIQVFFRPEVVSGRRMLVASRVPVNPSPRFFFSLFSREAHWHFGTRSLLVSRGPMSHLGRLRTSHTLWR